MRIPRSESMRGVVQIQVEDPALSEGSDHPVPDEDPRWQGLDFVSSLPIVKARIGAGDREHEVRFMIDSGEASSAYSVLLVQCPL